MRKDSRHQYSLQLLSAEELEKSPTWQQIRTAYQHIEKIRERLPQYTSEQLEKIWVALKTPAENSALDRLIAEARERREQGGATEIAFEASTSVLTVGTSVTSVLLASTSVLTSILTSVSDFCQKISLFCHFCPAP